MKRFVKKIITSILAWQVQRLYAKNNFKTVVVVGSIGKTSTKFAVAETLSAIKKVRWQKGNYNDIISVPLVYFGHAMPVLYNPLAWLTILLKNEWQLLKGYPYEVVVLELGTDGPGQIRAFERYVQSDLSIVTAITPEHMEFFEDLDAVAREELSVAKYSKRLLINADLCGSKYLQAVKLPYDTFGTQTSDVKIADLVFKERASTFTLKNGTKSWLSAEINALSKAEVYSATAAAIAADKFGMEVQEIAEALKSLQPVSGRMQRLNGIKNSLILDETYNASPDAMIAALDSLYTISAPQKIALLGNMNELGDYSSSAHKMVGNYCDPKQLDYVITLGPDANKYLAAAAKQAGCKVREYVSPYEAGEFIKSIIQNNAVVLAKGSQNNVYAEEALKILLANPADEKLLVRQTNEWLKKKKRNFSNPSTLKCARINEERPTTEAI